MAADIEAHQDIVYDLVWLDDDRLASAGDGEVKLWDCSRLDDPKQWPVQSIASLRSQPDFEPVRGTAYALAVSSDRSRLVCVSREASDASRGLLRIWDLETGERVAQSTHRAISLAFDKQDRRLFLGTQRGEIDVVDAADPNRHLGRLDGHTSNVYRMACSPDGRWLASASKDATIRLWDLQAGFEPRVFQCHERRVYSVDFSLTNSTLVSASADGTMRQFEPEQTAFELVSSAAPVVAGEAQSGESEAKVPLELMDVSRGLNHRPSDSLLMVDRVGRLVQWSRSNGSAHWLGLTPWPDAVAQLTVSDHGLALIPVDWWNRSETVPAPLETPQQRAAVMIPPDAGGDEYAGRFTVFGQTGALVWQPDAADTAGNRQPPRMFAQRRSPTRWLPASSSGEQPRRWYLCDSSEHRLVGCWQRNDGHCEYELIAEGLSGNAFIQPIAGRGGPPGLLVVEPCNGRVHVCRPPQSGEFVDWRQRIELPTQLSDIVAACAVRPADDAAELVMIADESGSLERHRIAADGQSELVQRLTAPGRIWAMRSSRQGQTHRLDVAGPDGVFRYHEQAGHLLDSPQQCLQIDQADWAGLPPSLAVYDLARGRLISHFHPLVQTIHALAISADGNRIVVIGESGVVRMFSRSGQLLGTAGGLDDRTRWVVFSSDNRLVCVTCADDIVVYDTQQKQILYFLKGHDNTVQRLAVGKRRRLLASASSDLSVRLWSLDSGREVAVLVGHTAPPEQLCFSLDERLLVSADRNGIVKVWDIETHNEVLELGDHQSWPLHLAFENPGQLEILSGAPSPQGLPGYALGRWSVDFEAAEVTAAVR